MNGEDYIIIAKSIVTLFAIVAAYDVVKSIFTDDYKH